MRGESCERVIVSRGGRTNSVVVLSPRVISGYSVKIVGKCFTLRFKKRRETVWNKGCPFEERVRISSRYLLLFCQSVSQSVSRTNPSSPSASTLLPLAACGRQPSGKHLTHTAQSFKLDFSPRRSRWLFIMKLGHQ